MLQVKNVTKTFGSIKAVDQVSFEIKDKEFVFLTGPSGAGKTTLLRLIIGDLKPDSGGVIVDGKDIAKLSPKELPFVRRQIGVVFQDYKLFPEKTVEENIQITLAVIGLAEDKWEERVKRVLKETNLVERRNLFPSQLSGGELQRLALARALVIEPKLILADEPTGNLDWETADHIMAVLERENKEGKTVIVASHHKDIIKKMDKKIIELKNGKIVK